MPGFIGLPEILLLGLVVLLVFEPKRPPEMGRSMGPGLREFKDSISGHKEHDDEVDLGALTAATLADERPRPVQIGHERNTAA